MIDDMSLRKLNPTTQKQYIRSVKIFTQFLGRSPDTATVEDLRLLRQWWRLAQAERKMLKGGWLFPGQNPVNPMSTRQFRRAFHASARVAGINKRVSLHSLRHAFAI